jgi:hypothetical protein
MPSHFETLGITASGKDTKNCISGQAQLEGMHPMICFIDAQKVVAI